MQPDETAYREAEARYWTKVAGGVPADRVVHLADLDADVRVQEWGAGPPLLFLHGGPNAGSTWAPLVGKMDGYRCLVVDRPGCGLSSVARRRPKRIREYMAALVASLLASIEPTPVGLVASSFGSYAVLAHHLTHPTRALPAVHMGCPGMVPGSKTPWRMMLMLLPGLRQILLRFDPPTVETAKRMFRQIGHGPSIDSGRIPEVGHEWYASLLRDTNTRDNELDMFGSVRPADMFKRHELEDAPGRASFFWGTDDNFGDAELARDLVATLGGAPLELLPDSGHLPWLDNPGAAAHHVKSFMEGLESET